MRSLLCTAMRAYEIDSTEAVSQPTQCKQCRTWYTFLGVVAKWWYVNGRGPFCEKCMKKGVTVPVGVEQKGERGEP